MLDDSLADCQPDPCSGISLPGMQALEDPKNPLVVFAVNTDTVVLDRKNVESTLTFSRDHDMWGRFAPVLNRIGDQVLEHLLQAEGRDANERQIAAHHFHLLASNSG